MFHGLYSQLCSQILSKMCRQKFNFSDINYYSLRTISLGATFRNNKNNDKSRNLPVPISFESPDDRSKETYLDVVNMFVSRDVHRRGHVEFIYSALKYMKEYGVHKDLEVYKSLIDVLPKGKFIPTNVFQAEFMHYPKQQQCAIDLLQQMEDNGTYTDYVLKTLLIQHSKTRNFGSLKMEVV